MTNAACDDISTVAWQNRIFNQFGLQKLVYNPIRESTGLTAQVVIRAIRKVADAYKLDKKSKRTFRPHGGIAYDARILRWFLPKQEVSIWSVGGRLVSRLSADKGSWNCCKGNVAKPTCA